MNPPLAPVAALLPPSTRPLAESEARLYGRTLFVARAVWLAIAALDVALFTASVPVRYSRFIALCSGPHNCGGLTAAQMQALRSIGINTYAVYANALDVIFALVFGTVAALLFWRKSDERMGLFSALALLTFGTATFPSSFETLALVHPFWHWPVMVLALVGGVSMSLLFFRFPDGRFVPRAALLGAVPWIVAQAGHYLLRGTPLDYARWPVPLTLLFFVGGLGSAAFAQIYRYRHVSNPLQRQQTKWIVYGVSIGFGAFLAILVGFNWLLPAAVRGNLVGAIVAETAVYAALLLIPLTIGVAILRYRLWDIDLLINRTLVYVALTACVIGLYGLIVGTLGVLLEARGGIAVSLISTGLIAVLFQPLRERLQRAVNRLLYGDRDEPYTVLSRLGRRLEDTFAPEAVLPAIVETVSQALKLPYAAIALWQDDGLILAAAHGLPAREPLAMPLVYQHEQVGQLLLAPRAPGEAFSPADQRLLDDLARQAGIAAHAVRLTEALQRSRERLVAAREEERRRIRRDLHDGLGPTLAGLTLRIDAARNLLTHDPAAAEQVLLNLKTQTQSAVADIRRLVYDLRPPALDDLGLLSALREQAAQHVHDGLAITVEAPDLLPSLPAAVEVAAYRIVQEALTNMVRHAEARTCTVRLVLDSAVHVEVCDDGRGMAPERQAGLGLASMRERAEELGGACVVEAGRNGGTCVRAMLPYAYIAHVAVAPASLPGALEEER